MAKGWIHRLRAKGLDQPEVLANVLHITAKRALLVTQRPHLATVEEVLMLSKAFRVRTSTMLNYMVTDRIDDRTLDASNRVLVERRIAQEKAAEANAMLLRENHALREKVGKRGSKRERMEQIKLLRKL